MGAGDSGQTRLIVYGSSNYTEASGQMRAPIFYDSDNTGYYIDAASTSKLLYVRPNQISCQNNGDYGAPRWDLTCHVVEQQHHYGHNASQMMYLGEANPVTVPGDIRAPIFYDNNDTPHYCDPNSTSMLVRIQAGPQNGSTSSGNTGSLEIKNASGTGDGGVAAIAWHCQGHYGLQMHLRNDGYFGIGGWSSGAWRWYSDPSGNMTASGNITAYSDPRLKEDLQQISSSIEKLMSLTGYKFKWKEISPLGNAGKSDYGILSSDVEKIAPELIVDSVHESPDGDKYKTVAYEKLIVFVIEAIKDQQKQIEELKKLLESK